MYSSSVLSYSEFKNLLRIGKTPFLLPHTNNYTKLKDMVHLSSAGNVNMKMIEIQVRKQDSQLFFPSCLCLYRFFLLFLHACDLSVFK